MKKLALCIALAAFTLVPALQAGDGCCPASKTADNKDAKATCPMSKDAKATCPMSANKEKGGCCAKTAKAKLTFDSSAKGATQLVKK